MAWHGMAWHGMAWHGMAWYAAAMSWSCYHALLSWSHLPCQSKAFAAEGLCLAQCAVQGTTPRSRVPPRP